MKKTILSSVFVMIFSVYSFVQAGFYGGGSGTADDPYQIRTAEQMNTIGLNPDDWAGHFQLMNDINMYEFLGDPDNCLPREYNIIGSGADNPFSGTFDGNGYVISNFSYYNGSAPSNYVGLFGYTSSTAKILNLGLEDVYFGAYYSNSVGVLVGYNKGEISGCYITGMGGPRGANRVGGLVGENWPPGTITACYSNVSIIWGKEDIGGLAGLNQGIITMSYANCSVIGEIGVGGLVGRNYGSISKSYATGWLSGELFWSGGLTGLNSGTVADCYADLSVNGGQFWSGGLIGWNSGSVTDCYSASTVSGGSYVGGFAGGNYSDGIFSGCFWDEQSSGTGDGVGDGSSSGLTGKTQQQMYMAGTFVNAGWDFSDDWVSGTWRMCSDGFDYPQLWWQFSFKGDLDCPDGVALEDLVYLVERWLLDDCGDYKDCDWADVNRDGIVNSKDFAVLASNWLDRKPPDIDWVAVELYDWYSVEMSRYHTTNAQYAQYLNSALNSGHIRLDGNLVIGVRGLYSGQVYYQLYMLGHTGYGATNGGASRINYSNGKFTVDTGFENHPVTYVSWYGATAFADYYGWVLPTEYQWEDVARYTDTRVYATGRYLYDYDSGKFLANYRANGDDSLSPSDLPYHPWVEHGTSEVGYFGTFGYGLADMAGNVSEWTSTGTAETHRTVRGGSWASSDQACSVWWTGLASIETMSPIMGFRVCR